MADLNDKLAQAADSEVHRSSWQATNPDFGVNKAAIGTMTGGALPQQPQTGIPVPQAAMGAQDPLEMLKASSTPSQEPLSLDTITDAQKEKIMKSFRECRNIANTQYTEVVEPRILHRRDVYQGTAEYYDKVFPILSQTSRWVSKDVKTSCNWILTGMMEAFCGTDAPLSVKGVNVDDDEVASKVQELVRYQLEKKNDWYHFCQAALRCALSENFAVAKVWWKHEEKRVKMEFLLDLQDLEQIIALTEGVGTGEIQNVEITELGEGVDDLVKCSYEEVKVTANHPVIEFVPSSELRYTPDAPNLQDCKFVAHRKLVRGSYLKQREMDGVYKNIDKALEEYDPGDISSTMLDRSNDIDRADSFKRPSDEDNASKEVELYEAYLQVDWNNDGIYENVIVHAVGDEPIRISENDYGFPPFFICSSEYDPNAVFNRDSSTDMLEQQQDLKTAVMRQIITNVAKNNAPRVFVNELMVDMDALMEGDEIISTRGDPSTAVLTPPSLPIAGLTMDVINYAQTEIESQSGSTRYNQGLNSDSLNKMLALDTPIPLIDGSYKLNKDIVEGDLLVGSDGKATEVLKAHPIQLPERAFKITFENGDVIKAGGEHRWSVKMADKNYNHRSKHWEKLPTFRIYDLMKTGHKAWVPAVHEIDFTEKDLPIDPYVLGAWLGDGNAHTNRFTSMDKEVVEGFKNWAEKFYKGHIEPAKQQHAGRAVTYVIVNTPFRIMLKDMHLLKDNRYENCKGNVKHIPDIYLQGSFEQRLALLQGLMDTDGCITRDGQSIFCNSEPALIESFVKLIHSFGLRANVRWFKNSSDLVKTDRLSAHVYFSAPFVPVRIQRKVDRFKTKSANKWGKQRIVSIEEIPVEPMRCLTVSAEDELYCCGNVMTLTSNTATGVTAILGMAEKRNKMVARSIAERFFIPIYKFVILLNQKYLEDEQMIRLTNKTLSIRKEDLDIDYDLIVNVGQGAGTREAQIQYLMLVLNQIYPQLATQGIVNAKSWYNLVVKLLEALGLRDVSQYLLDPESPEAQQQAMAAQQAAAQAQAEALQNSLQLAIAKSSVPRVNLSLENLPPDAQREYLKEKLGIDTTERAIAEHEVLIKND